MSTQSIASGHGGDTARSRLMTTMAENRGWFVLLGFITVVAGVAALAFPMAASIAVEIIVGSLFVGVGMAQVVMAFATRNWSGFLLQLAVGTAYVVAGGFMLARPVEGTLVLTLAAGATFIADGIVRLIWSSQTPRGTTWGWLLASGAVAIAIGGALIAGFPSSSPYALGVLAGLNFLVSGWATMTLAVVAKDPKTTIEEN